MAQVLPKHNDVMKTHVQSTEDSVTGTNGLHAPLNVEEEIKQETDDVIALSRNSVDWNASAIFQNANVVTWIHVHLNAQHNHFKNQNYKLRHHFHTVALIEILPVAYLIFLM